MEGFEFTTELHDGITAATKQQVSALGAVEKALHGVDHAEQSVEHHGGMLSHAWEEASEFGNEFTKSLIPQIAAAELAAEAIKKLGESIIEGAHFAVEAAEFKENAILAYEAVQGTAEEGEETFKAIDKLAMDVRMPAAKAHDMAKTLMVQGLENQQLLTSAISSVGNLQRVGMEAGAQRVQKIIETSLATGHFELSKKQLRGTGLNLEDIYGDLAKRLHKSRDEIKEELKQGKVDAEVGIASITSAINSGKIGEIADKKFDLTDAVTVFGNEMRGLFQDVDVGPLKQGLVDFVSIFDKGAASGATMHDAVTGAVNGIIRVVGEVITKGTEMILDFEIWGLKIELWGLKNKHAISETYESIKAIGMAVADVAAPVGKFLLQVALLGGVIPDAFHVALVAVEGLAKGVMKIGEAIGFVADKLHLVDHGATALTPEQYDKKYGGAGTVVTPPAHAEGGVVARPPEGEAFAAVKPGEMILPERFAMPLLNLGRSDRGSDTSGTTSFEWHGDVIVNGNADHASIRESVTSALTDVLEKVRLEMGA